MGTNDTNVLSNMGPEGKPLASLRAWRDYFQNANIYGADIDKNILKDEDRIKMFTDAIKDKKVTRFIKDYAARNKDVIDMGIKKGFLTKEQAINDLGMKNEYR